MRRPLAGAAPLLVALLMLAGCGRVGVTAARLEDSLAGTFARLYVLQQQRQGQPQPDPQSLRTMASCLRGTQSARQAGAGNDWACQVSYLVDGPGTPVRALYNVAVHTDGCWSADGDGPASVNGARTVFDSVGRPRVNPLYLIDGCFDAG